MPLTPRPRAPGVTHGPRKTRGYLLKQAMDRGPQQRHQTLVVEESELATGRGQCDLDVRPGWPQDHCDEMCYGRQAAGGRRGSRLELLPGSREPDSCWLVCLVSADHGHGHVAGSLVISWDRPDGTGSHPMRRAWACPRSLKIGGNLKDNASQKASVTATGLEISGSLKLNASTKASVTVAATGFQHPVHVVVLCVAGCGCGWVGQKILFFIWMQGEAGLGPGRDKASGRRSWLNA
eukprot:351689-Chlamydomonas_euryale.AAC.2